MLRSLMEKEEAKLWALKQINPAIEFKHAPVFREVMAMHPKEACAQVGKRVLGKYPVLVSGKTVFMSKTQIKDFELFIAAVKSVDADYDQDCAWLEWTSIREL